MSKLKVEDLMLRYHTIDGETEAVKNFSMDVTEGEFLSIIGPSGCGKSTILSVIAGLLKPSGGKIYIDNEILSYPCNKIGYMLQKDHLFEWRNIFKNITLGLEIQGKLNENSIARVVEKLEKYGLTQFKDYRPSQLSGGMRQRVALIRTLAINPDILLLDEPFSSLDYQTRLAVCDEIYNIIKEEGKTAIMVTHDIAEAISVSDRIILLSKRPALIKNIYTVKLSIENRTPLTSREAPEFRNYFNTIWKELDVHVK